MTVFNVFCFLFSKTQTFLESSLSFFSQIVQHFPNLQYCLVQEALYDKKKQKGPLFNKLNYNARRKRAGQRALDDIANDDADDWTPEEKQDLLEFFRHCVVSTDRQKIEQKLRETVEYRRKMIVSSIEEFMEMWEFYFAAPDLVSMRVCVCLNFFCYNRLSFAG